ncbi:hypothetical protein [Paenibacillus sp. GP183]|jgi:D-galactarolactone cycloisomerase|nr:hypothetical protein [Paenibacillus sp. GP183]SEC00071.1 hypothetical protein SAMN05443246_2619 [Paenibacillus sp. GP183]
MKITAIDIKHYLLPLDPPFKAAWDPNPRKKFASWAKQRAACLQAVGRS